MNLADIRELDAWRDFDGDLECVELRAARDRLAVYAGLHIPAEIEADDMEALHKLPMASRYIPAAHHRLLIEKLEAVESGQIKRLAIFMPPGSAKSTYASTLFPAWYLGRHPTSSIIAASQNEDLADRFGRRTRNLVGSKIHRDVFGSGLAADQRAAGHWETERGGEYHATGIQPFAGRRADGVILDDLIRGRKDADSITVRNSVWEWYLGDIRPRLKPKPPAWLVLIMTRWHEDDPAGRILPKKDMGRSGWVTAMDGERWYVLSLVAAVETDDEARFDPLGRKVGEILWPEWFTPELLAQEKRSQGGRNWRSLYQQKPSEDEGSILLRAHWRAWPAVNPPKCEFVIAVYDTAYEEGEDADFTARTTWGIFLHQETDERFKHPGKRGADDRYCAILLERFKARLSFPALREEAKRHYTDYQPDKVLIEKKVSGHSLIQELRRARIPVRGLKADKSKLARAHAASVVLEQGCAFYMSRMEWPQDVIDECARATFKKGDPGNDVPDTVVHALNYLRQVFHLRLPEEANADAAVEEQREREKFHERRFV